MECVGQAKRAAVEPVEALATAVGSALRPGAQPGAWPDSPGSLSGFIRIRVG